MEEQFTRYEKSRILGARALQIAMNAPLLIKISKEDLEKVNYDALKIAEMELDSEILPISIKRPLPKRKEDKLRRIREGTTDKEIEEKEVEEEEKIAREGEIMELANPEDEQDEEIDEEANEVE